MARNSMGGAGYSTVSMDLPDDIQQLMNMRQGHQVIQQLVFNVNLY